VADGPEVRRSGELSFLTWNLALLERPSTASPAWSQSHTEAAVREVVLDRKPDLVLFQELPGLVPFVETHAMVPANPRSHSGNLATLVRHDLMATEPATQSVGGFAIATTFEQWDLTVANVHLAPGRGGADERLVQLSQVIESIGTSRLVVVGDTNTRLDEADDLVSLGLTTERPPQPTWDSRRNRFRDDSPEFTAYFTRWFAGGDVAIDDVTVWHEPVDFQGERLQLSDHYALSATIRIG